MIARRFSSLVLLALLLSGAPSASAQVVEGPRSSDVDALLQPWDDGDSPGAAVLVMREGKILHSRGYGSANLEEGAPITPATVFDGASLAKQFAAMAVLLLVDDGLLDLDDDVRSHLPEMPDFGERITLRQLLHHTAGLRDWPQTLVLTGWTFRDPISLDDILEMVVRQGELNFAPGSDYAYSNTGYNLLAEIVARTTGQSFADFSRERIFAPLGMSSTSVRDDPTEASPGWAMSYAAEADGSFRLVPSYLAAPGSSSIFTTAEDLALWIDNFRDPVVGDATMLEAMHRQGTLGNGDSIDYALGQEVAEYRGLRVFTHGGAWAGYRSIVLRVPETDFAVAILANTSTILPTRLALRVVDLYLADDLLPFPVAPADGASGGSGHEDPPQPWNPDVETLREFVGSYESPELRSTWRLELVDDRLVARHARGDPQLLHPVAADRFQAYAFGDMRFERSAGGEVESFTANSSRVRGLRFHRKR